MHNKYLENYIGRLNGNVEKFDVVLVTADNMTSKEKETGCFLTF